MTDILKAALGVLVGALPVMLLWIIIGKIGYTASIGGGSLFYKFAKKR